MLNIQQSKVNPDKQYGHILAYFLSRFNKQALESLGYGTDREAFGKLAEILGVLPNYLKFRRDEFDVEHPHRKGWHKRAPSLRVTAINNTFKDLDFHAIESIVRDILDSAAAEKPPEDILRILTILEAVTPDGSPNSYGQRGLTGKIAELAFMDWFANKPNFFGENARLEDRRDHGCGYDFRIQPSEGVAIAVEVKGLSASNSGIMLTSKEWEMATMLGKNYFLALVSAMDSTAIIELIADPAHKMQPKRNIQTVIQVNWTLSAKDLSEHREAL